MDFRLSEADRVLIEHVREFGVKYFNQDAVAQWRSDMGLPDEVVRDFVNLDFNGFVRQPGANRPHPHGVSAYGAFGVRICGVRAFRRIGHHEHEHARAHRRRPADHER